MYAASPEIRTVEVLLRVVTEQALHVLAYERRRIVVRRLKTVDDCWRARQQMLCTLADRRCRVFGPVAFADVAPGVNHFDRLALVIAYQSLRIIHPAVTFILLTEAVLNGMSAFLEQLDRLGFYRAEFIR